MPWRAEQLRHDRIGGHLEQTTASNALRRRSVVVCDRDGTPLSTAGVLEAHSGEGILHRAFSAFVFRKRGEEVLLQQRSSAKATFPLLWSNTCCSHPFPADASICAVAKTRMQEELGFGVDLVEVGSFVYRARDESSVYTEYEHDSVLVASVDGDVTVNPDPNEVADCRWISVRELCEDLSGRREKYSPWLPGALEIALKQSF